MSTAIVINGIGEPLTEELEEIFRDHYPMVYRTAYSLTGSPQDAEAIVQSLFVQLLQARVPERPQGSWEECIRKLADDGRPRGKACALTHYENNERIHLPALAFACLTFRNDASPFHSLLSPPSSDLSFQSIETFRGT